MAGHGFFRISIREALRKSLILCLAIAVCSLVLTGCDTTSKIEDREGNPSATGSLETSSTGENGDTGDAAELDPRFSYDDVTKDNIFEFITLGQYKGIVYDAAPEETVTEDKIDARIKSDLSEWSDYVEITDRAVQMGDTAIIDFMGFLDGVPFTGGSAEGADLVIGSGTFIPGFEEQIVGHVIGDEFDINVTFPADYGNSPELAGQHVVFKIKLHAIYSEIPPELTDEFVQDNLGMGTIAEYRETVRAQLEVELAENAENYVRNQIWGAIFADSTIHKYPQVEIDFRMNQTFSEIEYMAMMYNVEVSVIVQQYTGLSIEDFVDLQLMPSTISDVGFDLILRAIAATEGIYISDADFDEAVAGFIEEYGYEDEEQFFGNVGKHSVYLVLLSPAVEEIVMSSAIQR